MNGKPLARPFVPADVIREIFPKADDREVDFLLWEFTGWPSFFHTDYPDDEIRECMKTLRRALRWRRILFIRRYPDPIMFQMSWRWVAKYKVLGRLSRWGVISYERFNAAVWGA